MALTIDSLIFSLLANQW